MEDDKLILDNLINLAHTDIELATQLNKGLQLMDEVELRRIYFTKEKLLYLLGEFCDNIAVVLHKAKVNSDVIIYCCPHTLIDVSDVIMETSNGFLLCGYSSAAKINGNWAGKLKFTLESDPSLPYGVFIFIENKKL